MSALITVHDLAVALQLPNLSDDDEYAQLIIDQASDSVRDYAKKPGWVKDVAIPPLPGTELAPQAARNVTLWVAVRAYTNPRNLSRRGSGPISESYENGLWALELTPAEKERIDGVTGGSSSGGLWIQPIDGGWARRSQPMYFPTYDPTQPTGDVIMFDEGQFPYNIPEGNEGTPAGDVEYIP